MTLIDKDLRSIQEVRTLLDQATKAQAILADYNQTKIDEIIKAVSDATYAKREELAKMANTETGFGIWQDKVLKNSFASKSVYEYIKDMKTIGIINEDFENKVTDVAVPVGVVAGLIPSTNPTSTVIYKALISLKSGNSIVFSPHPNAIDSITETVRIIQDALASVGAPKEAVSVMTIPTLQGTNELMTNRKTKLILATGGNAMVRAAYSSGTPAIGVGPGNGPAYIEKSAQVSLAVKRIVDSKTFDNGTICASEQSIIVETANKSSVMAELENQGAYILSKSEADKLAKFILRPNGTMNPNIVGKSVQHIAKLADLNIPENCRLLVAEESEVGIKHPFSREKLAPIIALYTVDNWKEASELSVDILNGEGAGHTMILHTENQKIVKEFGLLQPVSRLLVNTPGALGGIGATTNLVPALTLGCGAIGGSSTSDNIGPENLFNIRRVTYGVRELSDLREESPKINEGIPSKTLEESDELIQSLVAEVLARLQ